MKKIVSGGQALRRVVDAGTVVLRYAAGAGS
jgi:hypothetical protein